jgi:hypothetical protein
VSQAGSDGLIVRARVVMGSSRTRASYTRCQRSRAALERALAQPRRTAAPAHRAALRRLAAAATGHLLPAIRHLRAVERMQFPLHPLTLRFATPRGSPPPCGALRRLTAAA